MINDDPLLDAQVAEALRAFYPDAEPADIRDVIDAIEMLIEARRELSREPRGRFWPAGTNTEGD